MNPQQIQPNDLHSGTMMVKEGLRLPELLGMETDAYSPCWRSVVALDSYSLGRKLTGVGWHFFFLAGEVNSVAFGFGGNRSLRKAVQRIAAKVRALDLNCLELTEIRRKYFLGAPYIAISAHACHIQQSSQLPNFEERRLMEHGVQPAEIVPS